MKQYQIGILAALFAAIGAVAVAQLDFTITNGSMTGSGSTIAGWGGYLGTIEHSAIDSPGDPTPGSGSLQYTFGGVADSVTQVTGLTATGQTLRGFAMDVAQDGTFTSLVVGFYEGTDPVWDVYAGATTDVIADLHIPADPTLNTFTTVIVPDYTFPSNGHEIWLYIGTSNSVSGYAGATVGSKMAIDNVHLAPPAEVADWVLFQ